VPFIGQAR
jgi:hypothetical protein